MRTSKISINQGYYLEGIENIYNIARELIRNKFAVFAIDSDAEIFISDKDKKIISDYLKPKKKYMKVEAEFESSEIINTLFKEVTVCEQMEIYTQEKEIWLEPKYHLDLVLYPFTVKIMEYETIIYPIIIYLGDEEWDIKIQRKLKSTEIKSNGIFLSYNVIDFSKISSENLLKKESLLANVIGVKNQKEQNLEKYIRENIKYTNDIQKYQNIKRMYYYLNYKTKK